MTITLLPIVHEEDVTGLKPANKVTNELHTLEPLKRRAISPTHIPFFKDGVVIRDVSNANRVLDPSEYSFKILQSIPTALIGKELYAIIIVENPDVSNSVSIDYQALGGEWSRTFSPTEDMINILLHDDRPSTYPNIIDRPSEFAPVFHFHSMGEAINYQYVLAMLERLRQTILIKDSLSIENLLKYVEAKTKGTNDKIASNTADILELFQTTSSINASYVTIQDMFEIINGNLIDSDIKAAEKIANYQANNP